MFLISFNVLVKSLSNNENVNIMEEKCITEEALQCMCNLLTSVTHFNFRLNLMTAIVTGMSTRKFTKVCFYLLQYLISNFQFTNIFIYDFIYE
jgi:hypothetical protein